MTRAPVNSRSAVLLRHRDDLHRLAERYRLGNVRVFGWTARGEDTASSDVDLLVSPGPGTSLLTLAGFAAEVEDILGCEVDVTSDRCLPAADSPILRDARAL